MIFSYTWINGRHNSSFWIQIKCRKWIVQGKNIFGSQQENQNERCNNWIPLSKTMIYHHFNFRVWSFRAQVWLNFKTFSVYLRLMNGIWFGAGFTLKDKFAFFFSNNEERKKFCFWPFFSESVLIFFWIDFLFLANLVGICWNEDISWIYDWNIEMIIN